MTKDKSTIFALLVVAAISFGLCCKKKTENGLRNYRTTVLVVGMIAPWVCVLSTRGAMSGMIHEIL